MSRTLFPVGVLALSLTALSLTNAADSNSSAAAWKSDLLAWRAKHAQDLQQPNGSLLSKLAEDPAQRC